MNYRPEIDGLRAVAVLSVVFSHAEMSLFQGGFVGVDVFFVISGYLIATIIKNEIDKNDFSVTGFYKRRVRRIFPVLFFVVFVSYIFTIIFLLPYEIKKFSQSVVSVLSFSSNFYFWSESGYWSPIARLIPLIHTWSLAVEEQFYLVFPVLYLFSCKYKKINTLILVFTVGMISLFLAHWGSYSKPSAAFYLLPTRMWEIIVGVIIALGFESWQTVGYKSRKYNELLSILGFILVVFSVICFSEDTPFPSFYTLIPVIGSALIIVFSSSKTTVFKILSCRILVFLGLISYSIYLWHQPVFSFARHISSVEITPRQYVFLCILTITISCLSWKYIELPFRRDRFSIKIISIAAVFLIMLGVLGSITNGFEKTWMSMQSETTKITYGISSKNRGNRFVEQEFGDCHILFLKSTDYDLKKIVSCYKKYGKGYVVIGDSHAMDLLNVLIARNTHPFIVGFTNAGCRFSNVEKCDHKNVIELVKANANMFDGVVYEQAGFTLLESDSGKKGRVMFSRRGYDESVEGISINKKLVAKTYRKLDEMTDYTKVIWFGSRVEPHISKKTIVRKGCDFKFLLRENQREAFEKLDNYIDELVSNQGELIFVSQNKAFDYQFPDDFMSCSGIFWSDGDHLSPLGEREFGKRFDLLGLFATRN